MAWRQGVGNPMSSTHHVGLYRKRELREVAEEVEMKESKALEKWKKCPDLDLWAGGLGTQRKIEQ